MDNWISKFINHGKLYHVLIKWLQMQSSDICTFQQIDDSSSVYQTIYKNVSFIFIIVLVIAAK